MTPLQSIKEKILQTLSGAVLVRVDKSFIKKDLGGYCFDGVVLNPLTNKDTGEIIKEVSINPVWGGNNGQGIFCPPDSGQVVVVNFIGFNRAFPYYVGIYGDNYSPADGADGQFVLTDGKGGIFKLTGDGLFSLLNNSQSLKSVLESIVDGFIGLVTVGSPSTQTLNPTQIAKMTKLKTDISLLFKE